MSHKGRYWERKRKGRESLYNCNIRKGKKEELEDREGQRQATGNGPSL